MSSSEFDPLSQTGKPGAVNIYCMGALVADEASRNGFLDLARSIENVLCGFLSGLPRDEQRQALRVAYEMALGGDEPAPPRLRLVYSRD
ncbi:hypothetical protein [Aestuariivirga sp.]|uniref:hypothetical protein n=1 Tax=Aestuariivirga sp. TaxID=2650926 RepID=UPI0035933E44